MIELSSIKFAVVVAASFLSLVLCWTAVGEEKVAEDKSDRAESSVELSSGDLVFQDSSPISGQAEAIKVLTRSPWSHCGLYFERPGLGAVVVDGNGTGALLSWDEWSRRGKDGKFSVYRLKAGLSEDAVEKLWTRARQFDGRPYDLKFAWDDERIYCSELIWKAYRDALGVELGRLQKLRDFELENRIARSLIERSGSWGTLKNALAHGDELVISPQAITKSFLLQRVAE